MYHFLEHFDVPTNNSKFKRVFSQLLKMLK